MSGKKKSVTAKKSLTAKKSVNEEKSGNVNLLTAALLLLAKHDVAVPEASMLHLMHPGLQLGDCYGVTDTALETAMALALIATESNPAPVTERTDE